jgi:hypothetical protein
VGAIPETGLGTNTVLVAVADVRLHQHVLNDLLASPPWLPRLLVLEDAADSAPSSPARAAPAAAGVDDATVAEVGSVLTELAAAMTAAGTPPPGALSLSLSLSLSRRGGRRDGGGGG